MPSKLPRKEQKVNVRRPNLPKGLKLPKEVKRLAGRTWRLALIR